MHPTRVFLFMLALCVPVSAICVPSIVEKVGDGVYVVRDDHGRWGGMTTGITHQNKANYLARKTLDLTALPVGVWASLYPYLFWGRRESSVRYGGGQAC